MTSRTLSGTSSSATSRSPRQAPAASNNNSDSLRCLNTSSTKKGLPSVSAKIDFTSDFGGSAPPIAASIRATSASGKRLTDTRRARWRRTRPSRVRARGTAEVEVGITVGPDEKDAEVAKTVGDQLRQQQRAFVGPLQVVEEHADGLDIGCADDEVPDAVVKEAAFLLRRQLQRQR